jgi:hypothetical protein
MTRTRVTAAALWLLAVFLTVGAAFLDVTFGSPVGAPLGASHAGDLAIPLIIVAFSTTGFFISTRRPGHPMGRLYLLSGALGALYIFSRIYSLTAKLQGWPGYVAGRVGEQLFYFPWILSMVALPIMLFPDGRLPSRRWRWLRWVGALFILWLAVAPLIFPSFEDATIADVRLIDPDSVTEVEGSVVLAADDEPRIIETEVITTPAGDLLFADGEDLFVTEADPEVLTDAGMLPNPLAIDALAPIGSSAWFYPAWDTLGLTSLVVILGAAPAALVTRFRRSDGIERQQLKWLVYPAAVAGVGLILNYTLDVLFGVFDTWWLRSIVAISLRAVLMIPVSTGLAIVRYRLYDIDRLISRTVVYGVLVALLAGAYVSVVFVLSQFMSDDNSLTVAIATLAVAALFNPLRKRIQDFIDRRLYRSQYDAREIVEALSSRLSDEVDVATIQDELLDGVDDTVKPEAAAIWIRSPQD